MKPANPVINNIKTLRLKNDLSLDDLADAVGIRKSSIWNLEKGLSYPLLNNAYKIALVVGCEVTDVWPNTFAIYEEKVVVKRKIIKDKP